MVLLAIAVSDDARQVPIFRFKPLIFLPMFRVQGAEKEEGFKMITQVVVAATILLLTAVAIDEYRFARKLERPDR